MAAASLAEGPEVARAASQRATKTWVLTLVVIATQAFGNLSLTWGMKHQTQELGLSPVGYIESIFSPWVALGVCLLIIWLLSRMTLLSWADLSFVLPVTSIGYVLSAVIGKYFFQEQVTPQRWVGTLLIVLGTIVVGVTQPNTTAPERT